MRFILFDFLGLSFLVDTAVLVLFTSSTGVETADDGKSADTELPVVVTAAPVAVEAAAVKKNEDPFAVEILQGTVPIKVVIASAQANVF